MACVALRCGGGERNGFLSHPIVNGDQLQQRQPHRSCSYRQNPPQAILKSNSQQIQVCNTGNFWKLPSMPPVIYANLSFCNGEKSREITSETLDLWMRDSVTDIVKNIKEAPFLVHVFSSKKNGKTKVTKLNREKAVAEEWPLIKRRWEEREERGECSKPDGIMLVEELKDEIQDLQGGSEKAWGIVIQGRGVNCNPACYILKTCRVGTPSIGFCTHFCLLKAQLYGETPMKQMKNSWLLDRQLLDQHSYFYDIE